MVYDEPLTQWFPLLIISEMQRYCIDLPQNGHTTPMQYNQVLDLQEERLRYRIVTVRGLHLLADIDC